MNRRVVYRVLACSAALLMSAPVFSQGSPAAASAAAAKVTGEGVRGAAAGLELRAKVVELDRSRRTAALRRATGEVVVVEFSEDIKNYDAINVGDDIKLRYTTAIVADIQPGSKKGGIRERVESSSTATAGAGQAPAVAGRRTVDVLAVIKALDTKKRKATLAGAKRTVVVDVPDTVDIKKLKVGDEVRASLIESAVLSVEPAAAKK